MEKNMLNLIGSSLRRHQVNLLNWLKEDGRSKALYLGKEEEYDIVVTKEDVPIIEKIEETLEQVDRGNFGRCVVCEGEVELEQLMLDFTTCVCLDHYNEYQLRELERDLELAAKVQRHLLPNSLPALDGVQMAVFSRPAGVVGGDYYDFFCNRDCWQGMVVADVMGKGISASMLMANLQASLRILGPDHDDLATLAGRINKLFSYNLKQIRFITMFLAALDPDNRTLHYANAGHHPPLLWNGQLQTHRWLKPTGPAIGLNPDAGFRSDQVQMSRGDVLILYTDGLVEARNGSDEFGTERLADFTKRSHTMPAESFLHELIAHLQDHTGHLDDDLTVMVMKVEE